MIAGVEAQSAAADKRLIAGDVVVEVSQEAVAEVTSTVSGNGDQAVDPNMLVIVTDTLAATSLPAGENFTTIRTAGFARPSVTFHSRRALPR
jgi:hypothetical protein